MTQTGIHFYDLFQNTITTNYLTIFTTNQLIEKPLISEGVLITGALVSNRTKRKFCTIASENILI